MNIDGLENVRDIFSIFHDGSISACALDGDDLTLEVEIQYLAERVNPGFRKFKVRLFGVSNVRFSTWPSDMKSDSAVLTDVPDIFDADLEILEGNLSGEEIEVVCNQHSSSLPYCGGELRFHCLRFEVTDEGGKGYSIEELSELSQGYWDEWSSRSQA
ncbi:hypothetical protein [Thauera sp. SDU_THAU2]|uniref:hypothetical protein n=1 Tax=Thauera sp. SDU_THAU2 TaxID=3136633 RepID=UPI00311E4756